jgi:hypothetical protein
MIQKGGQNDQDAEQQDGFEQLSFEEIKSEGLEVDHHNLSALHNN